MIAEVPLSGQESARLYWELSQRGAASVGQWAPWRYESISEDDLLLSALRQCRYDPRLLEVMVNFFSEDKFRLNMITFKKKIIKEGVLPVMVVIGEFVLESAVSSEAKELVRYLMIGAKPVPTQLFFSGLYKIGGKKMKEALQQPLWAFKKWGFLAADPPWSKGKQPKRTYLFDSTSRLHLLRDLSKEKGSFRLKDYLEALGNSVSRQQALKDLKSVPWIRKRGQGKGSFYQLAPRSRPLLKCRD